MSDAQAKALLERVKAEGYCHVFYVQPRPPGEPSLPANSVLVITNQDDGPFGRECVIEPSGKITEG